MNAPDKATGALRRTCAAPSVATAACIWHLLESVMDPELPQLSIVDLGMIRSVEVREGGAVHIAIAPTYSGCPAIRVIHERIRRTLRADGIAHVEVHEVLTPAWTSEWITERGREILRESGIAPPLRVVALLARHAGGARGPGGGSGEICCPRCRSSRTERVSEFGATPCKAQYRCLECLEPFECFKCI